jgi:hypothetical protein
MEVVTIDGKDFVKASLAARQAGYTADYVGQLARAGSIPARLVGRTWYVDTDALRSHRVEKKRFAREKAREQVKRAIEEKKVQVAAAVHLDGFGERQKNTPVYHKDEDSLFPEIQKKVTSQAASDPDVVLHKESNTEGQAVTPIKITFTTATTDISETNTLKHDSSGVKVVAQNKPAARRQVIAPRKKVGHETKAIQGTHAETKGKENKPLVKSKLKKRVSIVALLTLFVSIPFAWAIASFEVHTLLEQGDSMKTEYVFNLAAPVAKCVEIAEYLGKQI